MAEEKRINNDEGTVSRDSLTRSGGLVQSVAEAAVAGVATGVAAQVTSKLIQRPKKTDEKPHVYVQAGTIKPK